MKCVVVQKGAREHFAAARALHQREVLAGLVTDWYAFGQNGKRKAESESSGKSFQILAVSLLKTLGRNGKSASAAYCHELPDEFVRSFPIRSLIWKWKIRRLMRNNGVYDAYAVTDRAFASVVARAKLPEHDVFFGYSYASLEILEAEKRRGIFTILDQIDPGPAEFRLVANEMERYPEVAGPPSEFPVAYFDRNRREWELADVIVVNSEWSRELLTQQGADPRKIEILPLAYEPPPESDRLPSDLRPRPSAPLRVLWLGQVNVRKGIHYLVDVARLVLNEPVQFDIVGPLNVSAEWARSAPPNVTFHGPVSRDRAEKWYRRADIFVLPTLSDGFAITQLEAMAYGLPVITTPNCGRVVENGKTGFIVPPRDTQALVNAIRHFVGNRDLLSRMSQVCCGVSQAYSVASYGSQLVDILQKHSECRLCTT